MPITRYGQAFPDNYNDLQIEIFAIRKGGKWQNNPGGVWYGLGDIQHYHNVRCILWPELDDHRWYRICRDEILNGKCVVLAGCGSSGKTHAPAWIRLVEWICFPDETCVLVSSETIGGLRKRVWAEMTMLWQRAKDRFPDDIPGHLLDSALALTTDNLEDDYNKRRVRDMRKGIFGIANKVGGKVIGLTPYIGIKQKRMRLIADECFPTGTLVDTPSGKRPIESIQPGDSVISAAGPNRVIATRQSSSTRLMVIFTKDGREISCTPLHPFLTQRGWVFACNLSEAHYIIAANETMRILSDPVYTRTTKAEVLRSVLRFDSLPWNQIGNRSGWFLPLQPSETRARQEERAFSEGTWVDHIAVLEFPNTRLQGADPNSSGCRVFNLQVDGHPSYSVNGLIVHNCQMMNAGFLSAFANLNQNEDFRATIIGNFNDPYDALGKAACPKTGWSGYLEPTKTAVWDTEFMNGRCVNLIGIDSPNFDDPARPNRYPYLTGPRKIREVLSAFPKDSYEYMSQCVGSMKISTLERRVITRDLCKRYHAQEDVVWSGDDLTLIGGMDSAYGGDRCVIGHVTFGRDVKGKTILSINPPVTVPILVNSTQIPEEQIAQFVKEYCTKHGIPPENFFHDSTGRGTLGTFIARAWSDLTNPVEFGGRPTDRPVGLDLYVFDPITHQRRLKLCSEHYSKFVTELWWSVRYAIECEQVRNLPEDVMEEGCMRMWDKVAGDKYEIETKQDMKDRVGKSPDLMDWCAICVEGARRRGFQITKLVNEDSHTSNNEWVRNLEKRQRALTQRHSLNYAA